MMCIATNINIMFEHYIKIREASEYTDSEGSSYTMWRYFLLWGTVILMIWVFAAGSSEIQASKAEDVDAHLLSKFYTITGIAFFILSVGFFIILMMTI